MHCHVDVPLGIHLALLRQVALQQLVQSHRPAELVTDFVLRATQDTKNMVVNVSGESKNVRSR